MPTIASGFRLANGVKIPCIGLGTWQIPDDDKLTDLIDTAVDAGYRHFDTAFIYGNEAGVGRAVRNSKVPREKLFVTSKLWNADRGYDAAMRAFEATLKRMELSYLDLFLIHWPAAKGEPMTWQSINSGTWRALEDLYEQGLVRTIGVSNFMSHHLVPLLARARVAPMVNQIEFHPGYRQPSTFDFCCRNNIQVVAWSPLARGALVRNPLITSIAQAHNVTTGQVCLRWCLQHGAAAVVKSTSQERVRLNADLFSFSLSDEEMKKLDDMPQTGFSGLDPDHVTF